MIFFLRYSIHTIISHIHIHITCIVGRLVARLATSWRRAFLGRMIKKRIIGPRCMLPLKRSVRMMSIWILILVRSCSSSVNESPPRNQRRSYQRLKYVLHFDRLHDILFFLSKLCYAIILKPTTHSPTAKPSTRTPTLEPSTLKPTPKVRPSISIET